MRYIRFPTAAIAVDNVTAAPLKAPREPSPPTSIHWALNVHKGKLGTYAAIRIQGEKMWVGVKTASVISWVPAAEALTRVEAQAWFQRAQFSR